MLVLEWKGGAFIEKVNSRCFCWFPAAILVDSFCPPIWRLHTKLYKGAWNVSATNSETVGHKDLRFGQIVYILVFYNISFSWLLPLDGFKCIFLYRVYCVTVKTKYWIHKGLPMNFNLRNSKESGKVRWISLFVLWRKGRLFQPIRSTTQFSVVTRHQCGISAHVSRTSFRGEKQKC